MPRCRSSIPMQQVGAGVPAGSRNGIALIVGDAVKQCAVPGMSQ